MKVRKSCHKRKAAIFIQGSQKQELRPTKMPQATDCSKTLKQLYQTKHVATRGTVSHL